MRQRAPRMRTILALRAMSCYDSGRLHSAKDRWSAEMFRRPEIDNDDEKDRSETRFLVSYNENEDAGSYPMNPRLDEEKRPRFGKTVVRLLLSTPNQVARVAKY